MSFQMHGNVTMNRNDVCVDLVVAEGEVGAPHVLREADDVVVDVHPRWHIRADLRHRTSHVAARVEKTKGNKNELAKNQQRKQSNEVTWNSMKVIVLKTLEKMYASKQKGPKIDMTKPKFIPIGADKDGISPHGCHQRSQIRHIGGHRVLLQDGTNILQTKDDAQQDFV